MERILVIDDDVELCALVAEYMAGEGFQAECVHAGDVGLQRALKAEHILLVLDVMLPGLNGFEVLKRLRATSRMPVLLLTARGEDVDRILGLELGADDYLPKPFNPENWWQGSGRFCAERKGWATPSSLCCKREGSNWTRRLGPSGRLASRWT